MNSAHCQMAFSTLFRGAHFQKDFVGLSWLIHILNNFSWGFQKYDCFQNWTHPVDAQPLPCLPAQFWWATRLGRAWVSIGCVQIWKKLYFWNPHEKLFKICIGHQNPWCSGHPYQEVNMFQRLMICSSLFNE